MPAAAPPSRLPDLPDLPDLPGVAALAAALPVPRGRWAVGVSGGADSVALLLLLLHRRDSGGGLFLHAVHLDHQTRGEASAADAAFVGALASQWGLPCTIARRDEVEGGLTNLPSNPSARYRALRHETFRRTVAAHGLCGVALAHHADDQAETVLQRLLRGSGPTGLAGMSAWSAVGGLTILRPLLNVRRIVLRRLLIEQRQPWREDASNASDLYLRNRLRRVLAGHSRLSDDLLALADACRGARDWARARAPELAAAFPTAQLSALAAPLARESARRWLLCRGVPPEAWARSRGAMDRLLAMASDAATPPRQQFPGGVWVRRRGGVVWAE